MAGPVAASVDYFALLDLPRRFDVDANLLERRFMEAARRCHPDHAGADPDAQLAALQQSAQVNEAHRVLADPELRGNHLLDLLGGPSRQDASLPDGFLEELVACRELFYEAQEAANAPALDRLHKEAETRRDQCLQRFAAHLAAAPSQHSLAAARRELNALRYINRLLEQGY